MRERSWDVFFAALVIAAICFGMALFQERRNEARTEEAAEIGALLEKYAGGEAPSNEELAELLERYAPE